MAVLKEGRIFAAATLVWGCDCALPSQRRNEKAASGKKESVKKKMG